MTPLPKRRHSHHRTGKRRAAIKLSVPQLTTCTNCQQPTIPHRACLNCGYYNGEKAISVNN